MVLIGVIIIICTFLLMLVKGMRDNLSKRVFTVSVILWLVILIISSFNPYDLKPVSLGVYVLMLLYITSFVSGAMAFGETSYCKRKIEKINRGEIIKTRIDIEKIATDKRFIVIYLLCLLGASYLFYKQQAIIISENLGVLRENFYNLMFEGQPMLAMVYNYILAPFFYILIVVETYLLLYKRRWSYIILYFPFIILYGALAGGRIRFMAVIIDAIFMLLMGSTFGIEKKQVKKSIRAGLLLLIIIVGILSFVSMFRLGETEASSEGFLAGFDRFSEQIIVYSVGSLRAFDIALQNNYIDRLGGFQFGAATFCGVMKFFEPILRHLFGIQMEISYDHIVSGFLQTEEIDIGLHHYEEFNFAYTSAFIHYLDSGFIGVIIFPFLFGVLCRYTLVSLQYRLTFPKLVISSIYFYTILYSVFTFFLINGYGVEVLILMWIFGKFRFR